MTEKRGTNILKLETGVRTEKRETNILTVGHRSHNIEYIQEHKFKIDSPVVT
jgi:hypothetical protein